MCRRVCHRVFPRVGGLEQVRSREAVHVTANRQAHVVQNCGRQVDDRSAAVVGRCDVGAEGDQKPVRRGLVRAGRIGLAYGALEPALHQRRALHAEP